MSTDEGKRPMAGTRIVSIAALAAALLGCGVTAGCTGTSSPAGARSSGARQNPSSATPTVPTQPRSTAPATGKTGPLPSADPAPVRTIPAVGVRTLPARPLTAQVPFGTGVSVRVTRITHGTVTDTGPGALTGRPTVVFHLELANGSPKTVLVNTVQVTASYGNSDTPAVPANGTTEPFAGSLAAGKSTSGSYAFAVPVAGRERVDLTVSYRQGVPTVLLRGSAR